MNVVELGASEPPLKSVRRDDHDDECKYRDQIDLSGVVTPVADFPAHCFCPSQSGYQINAPVTSRFLTQQQCASRLNAVQQSFSGMI
jgi:hypothetical protein